MDRILTFCEQIGFSHFSPMDAKKLEFLPRVRAMCARDKCKSYAKSWSCPPRAGSLKEISEKASVFSRGVLVQTVAQMEDEYDLASVMKAEKQHKRKFDTLVRQTKNYYPDCMPMASGTCTRCRKCTYPDRRCRFPDRVYPSMEACGLMVKDVCDDNGLNYYYGKCTVAFTSCILLY